MEDGWERGPRLSLEVEEVERLVAPAFPGETVAEAATLSAGLANTNIRFRLTGREGAWVLRLHTRDPEAAAREREVMHHLRSIGEARSALPVPRLVYSDAAPRRGAHPYSIWSFVEGTLLQEIFETRPDPEIVECAGACGRVLAALAEHRFPRCGRFGPGLAIVEEYGRPSRFVPETVHRALFEGLAGERLGVDLRDTLWSAVEEASPMLAEIDDACTLVHADYKRSNLLLARGDAGWDVAAVLDWEFACAGPPLVDVGIFLRAGHALPDGFRDAFASAYRSAGGVLGPNWLPSSRLLDLVSQMTFLEDPRPRPRVIAETVEVVRETVRMLGRAAPLRR